MKQKEGLTQKLKKIFGILMGVLVIILLIRFVINNKDLFEGLYTIGLSDIIICFVITIGAMVCSSVMDRYLAEILQVKIGYVDCVGSTFIAAAINMVIPLGMGSVVRAQYLKQKCKLPYSKFVSVTAGVAVLQLIIILSEAMISLFISAISLGSDRKLILLCGSLFLGLIGGIYIAVRYQEWFMKRLPFKTYTIPIFKSFFKLFSSKKVMAQCTFLYVINNMLSAVRFYFVFTVLGSHISILNAILYQSIYNMSGLVYILPGNIGIGETLVGITNSFLGANFEAGVAATLVNRVIYYLVSIVGGVLFAIPMYRRYVLSMTDTKQEGK